MKAIVVREFGVPDVMKLEEVSIPQVSEKQVLVKIEAVGINPVDTYRRSGLYPVKPLLPYTPGSDAAGTIIELGEGVKKFSVGQRVYVSDNLSGAYAEFALCSENQVHKLPDSVSFEEGAGVNVPYSTAYRALFQKAHVKPSETVLIHGASGGVGIAAVQFARGNGLNIIGTAGTNEGLQLIKEQGVQHALNHHEDNYLDEVLKITNGQGVDVILEMLANVNLNKDLTVIKKGGRLVIIGNRGKIEFDPRLAMSKDATLKGMTLLNVENSDWIVIHAAIGACLEKGLIRPVIGERFKLEDAPKAHESIITSNAYGKIVLIP